MHVKAFNIVHRVSYILIIRAHLWLIILEPSNHFGFFSKEFYKLMCRFLGVGSLDYLEPPLHLRNLELCNLKSRPSLTECFFGKTQRLDINFIGRYLFYLFFLRLHDSGERCVSRFIESPFARYKGRKRNLNRDLTALDLPLAGYIFSVRRYLHLGHYCDVRNSQFLRHLNSNLTRFFINHLLPGED